MAEADFAACDRHQLRLFFIAKVYQSGKFKAWKDDLALVSELNDFLNS